RLSRLSCVAACAVLVQFAVWGVQPASAQVYYSTPVVSSGPLLPSPTYVVYSPYFLAQRSSGYYAGNWGPYYYNPPAVCPYMPAHSIYPIGIPYYPPVVPPAPVVIWR